MCGVFVVSKTAFSVIPQKILWGPRRCLAVEVITREFKKSQFLKAHDYNCILLFWPNFERLELILLSVRRMSQHFSKLACLRVVNRVTG
jgi:hypothetical protein